MLAQLVTNANDFPEDAYNLDQYSSNIGSIVTVIVVLVIIIGLIIMLVRFLAYKNNSWFQNRSVRHIGGVGVGQNKSVQLVKVGNSVYVVGVGEDVRLLDKIDDAEEIDLILETLNAPAVLSGKGLLSSMKNWAGSRKRSSVEEMTSPEAESFQELFHSKMQQVGGRRAKLKDLLEDDEKTDGRHS